MSTLAAPHFKVEPSQTDRWPAAHAGSSAASAILVATVDPDIRSSLTALLEANPAKIVSAKSVKEVRAALAKEDVSACFCGFWLVDGTYRDVMRHLKSRPAEIPAIIACPPKCPHESRDYLAALNIRGFDFICYPYTADDLERVLRTVISPQDSSDHNHSSVRGTENDSWDESGLRNAG
jgi:DNA-binding NtrC family response regulator